MLKVVRNVVRRGVNVVRGVRELLGHSGVVEGNGWRGGGGG